MHSPGLQMHCPSLKYILFCKFFSVSLYAQGAYFLTARVFSHILNPDLMIDVLLYWISWLDALISKR